MTEKQKCSKCGVNEFVHNGITIESKKFYDGLLCEPCYQELTKCQECKVNSFLIDKNTVRVAIKNEKEIYACAECHKKLSQNQAIEEIKEQIKLICEKIYSKYRDDIEEIKKGIFGVPVWLKHVDKETAQEFKDLVEPLKGKSAKELDKYFHYRFWLSQHEEYDPKSLDNCHKFVDNLTGLLGNLEEIININRERERERERRFSQMCRMR